MMTLAEGSSSVRIAHQLWLEEREADHVKLLFIKLIPHGYRHSNTLRTCWIIKSSQTYHFWPKRVNSC